MSQHVEKLNKRDFLYPKCDDSLMLPTRNGDRPPVLSPSFCGVVWICCCCCFVFRRTITTTRSASCYFGRVGHGTGKHERTALAKRHALSAAVYHHRPTWCGLPLLLFCRTTLLVIN